MLSRLRQRSPPVNPKQRIFGSAENTIMRVSQQRQGFMKVLEVLHLQGPHISLEELEAAVYRLQRRHPFLRSGLQINPSAPDSFLVEEDDTLRLKIREIPRKREEHLTFWRQEWREHEKDTIAIGQGLAEFWLLQDADDVSDENAPREIVFICSHSICDGVSLSVVAHELLATLGHEDGDVLDLPLAWPTTMENAVKETLPAWRRFLTLSKLIYTVLSSEVISRLPNALIPFGKVDFPLSDMIQNCHTEVCHASLNKEETRKLIDKCHQQGVTVTSAVSSAILCASAALVNNVDNTNRRLVLAIAADTRKRCVPIVPNHDLSYQVSAIVAFSMSILNTPTTLEGMWQLARTFAAHLTSSIDAGQILALGMIMDKLYKRNLAPPNLAQMPTCGLSNWGLLPFREQYGRWKLIGMTPGGNLIGAALPFAFVQTVNGVLTITYMGPDPVIPASSLEALCEETASKLRQMIE